MASLTNRLTGNRINQMQESGWFPDGQNLYLQVTSPSAKSWVFRYKIARRERRLGLGSYPEIPLKRAREIAANYRSLIQEGRDPKKVRDEERAKAKREQKPSSFEACSKAYIELQEPGWSNRKHANQWRNTLRDYALPSVGELDVSEIKVDDVLNCLQPIWSTKTETANRVRQRIEAIIDWAIAKGLRESSNPARWKGHLDKILPAPKKVTPVQNHPYMAIEHIPTFYAWLTKKDTVSALCLRFLILTGVRQSEAREAEFSEIDFAQENWRIPGHRMKMRQAHIVPLSQDAIDIVKRVSITSECGYLFSSKKMNPLSETAIRKLLGSYLEESNQPHCVLHGFRSCLRIWAEKKNYSWSVGEKLIAHNVGNQVQAAYLQTDFLEERRKAVKEWDEFVSQRDVGAGPLSLVAN